MMASQAPAIKAASRTRREKSKRPDPETQLKLIVDSLENSKADEIVPIPLSGKSSIADFMVVASGTSQRHVGSVAEKLISDMKDAGLGKAQAEGLTHCDWVLIDGGDIIVHIFRPEVRSFYNLEKMWATETPPQTAA